MAGAVVGMFVSSTVSTFVGEAITGAAISGLVSTAVADTVGVVIAGAVGTVAGQVVGGMVTSAFSSGGSQSAPSQVGAQQARGMLINAASNVDPLQVIYGSRRVGGTRVLCEVSGASNEYLNLVIALCEGEISAINTVYIDDVASTDARFSGLVTIEKYTGSDTQAASAMLTAEIPGKWTSAHQGKGVAALVLRLKYDQNAFHGLPVITCDIDGRLLYDPRDGLMKFSSNPVLCIRDYLTNTRYGRGISASLLDDASFITAANYCDTQVSIPGGAATGVLTHKLYECTGVVNVDDTVYANIQRMLTSCRGMLVFGGGKYRLLIDKAETPAFTFNEDNITGAWQFAPANKRDKFNRMTASFFNPDRSWQPDLAIQKSTVMLAQDNGLVLEKKLDLPFTADLYRAQHIIQQELKQSRFGLTVRFTALQDGLRCEAGDVVYVTHETPGWSSKPFRVISIDIKDSDEVDVVLREYDASVYTLDALNAKSAAPSTNLPNPFSVEMPGSPVVTESLYDTRGSAGVKSKASVTCMASPDIFVTQYQLEYKLQTASAWTVLPAQATNRWDIFDIAPGRYDFRVKAINALGKSSGYNTSIAEIYGMLAPPSNITGLRMDNVSSLAILYWDQSPDLDVRIGGKILIRHSPAPTGATWESSTSICPARPGSDALAVLPLKSGTYLVKAEDSSGIQSVTAGSISTSAATLQSFTTVGTVQEDTLFSGSKSGVYVDGTSLELVGAQIFDSGAGLFDSQSSTFDEAGGVLSSGTYTFAAGLDLGSVQRFRLQTHILTSAISYGRVFDSMLGLFDSQLGDFDGTTGAPVDAWIECRTTNGDPSGSPTWSTWQRTSLAEFNCRAAQFRAQLSTMDAGMNIAVTELSVTAVQ